MRFKPQSTVARRQDGEEWVTPKPQEEERDGYMLVPSLPSLSYSPGTASAIIKMGFPHQLI